MAKTMNPKTKSARKISRPAIVESAIYSVPETAILCHVSEATVWRWLRDRKIGRYRIGCRRIGISGMHIKVLLARDEERAVSAA